MMINYLISFYFYTDSISFWPVLLLSPFLSI